MNKIHPNTLKNLPPEALEVYKMRADEGNQMQNEERRQDWRDLDEGEWGDLLEGIDPDWTDHFLEPEYGLAFYEKYDSEIVANAVKEWQE